MSHLSFYLKLFLIFKIYTVLLMPLVKRIFSLSFLKIRSYFIIYTVYTTVISLIFIGFQSIFIFVYCLSLILLVMTYFPSNIVILNFNIIFMWGSVSLELTELRTYPFRKILCVVIFGATGNSYKLGITF